MMQGGKRGGNKEEAEVSYGKERSLCFPFIKNRMSVASASKVEREKNKKKMYTLTVTTNFFSFLKFPVNKKWGEVVINS